MSKNRFNKFIIFFGKLVMFQKTNIFRNAIRDKNIILSLLRLVESKVSLITTMILYRQTERITDNLLVNIVDLTV